MPFKEPKQSIERERIQLKTIEGLPYSVTNIEEDILSTLTEGDRRIIKALRRDNLVKDKARIVSIRSEDLLFFLRQYTKALYQREELD